MTLLNTLYPIPANVALLDKATNTFTGVGRFARIIGGSATVDDATYGLVTSSGLVRGNLNVQGFIELGDDLTVSGHTTLGGVEPLSFNGFGTNGTIYWHGQLGPAGADDLLNIQRVGLANYTWNFNGTLRSNGNAVWHSGNLTPGNYLTTAAAATTYVKLAGTTNLTAGAWRIGMTTASGSDTASIALQAGGANSNTRGAILELYGKNAAGSFPGGFRLYGDGASTISSGSGVLTLVGSTSTQLQLTSLGLAVTGILTVTGTIAASGAITVPSLSVGTISATSTVSAQGAFISSNPDALRMRQANRSVFWRFDSDTLYLMRTALNDPDGNWTEDRPFVWDMTYNNVTLGAAGTYFTNKATFVSQSPFGFTGFGAAGAIYIHGTNGPGDDVMSIKRENANSNYTMTVNGVINLSGRADLSIQLNPTGGRSVRFAATATPNTGFWDATNNLWLLRINGDNTINCASSLSATNLTATSESYCNNWFRSNTSGTGWYHQVHGGGVYMQDNDYLRSYQQKPMAASNFVIWSDQRSKENDYDLDIAEVLPAFMQLLPKHYTKTGLPEYGLFAQNVRALFPDMVRLTQNEEWDDYHFYDPNMMHAPHILVTQNNVRRIEELERIVEEQSATIQTLSAQVAEVRQ